MKAPQPVLQLAEQIGHFMEYWGFKEVHGQIWAMVFLSSTPVDAAYLVQNLEISKALVSITLKDLIKFKVVLEGDPSPQGTQTYISNPDLMSVILEVLRNRELKMLGEIKLHQELAKELPTDRLKQDGISPERLRDLGNMIGQAQNLLKLMLKLGTLDLKSMASALTFDRK